MGHPTQSMAFRNQFILISCIILVDLIDHTQSGGGNLVKWCYSDNAKAKCSPKNLESDWNLGSEQHVYCNSGKMQSPIDLNKGYEKMTPDSFINFTSLKSYDFHRFRLKNGGNQVELTEFETATGSNASFTRNGTTYTLIQIHLHWGEHNSVGSEHTIERNSFAMEMHLVHLKTAGPNGGYESFEGARSSKEPDALSVIAIFFKADSKAARNPVKVFTRHLRKIGKKGCSKKVIGTDLALPKILMSRNKAITYDGSLTTPGCDEIVWWVVIPEPVKVRPSCLRLFRKHLNGTDGKPIKKNYRPIQAVNGRVSGVIELKSFGI